MVRMRAHDTAAMRAGTETDYRAQYADGVLVSPKPGVSADPKPAAANDGTVITVSDSL